MIPALGGRDMKIPGWQASQSRLIWENQINERPCLSVPESDTQHRLLPSSPPPQHDYPCINNNTFTGPGEVALVQSVLLFQVTQVRFSATTWPLTTICNSSCRRFDLYGHWACVWCTYIYTGNTPVHIKLKKALYI